VKKDSTEFQRRQLRVAIRKITISAMDIAEWGRLDDQQLYAGHEAARRATSSDRPTNYATNCANWACPALARVSPSSIIPPVSPSKAEITVTRIRRLALCFGCLGDRPANGREAFGNQARPAAEGRLSGGIIGSRAQRQCTEQKRDSSRSGGNNPEQDPTVLLPQQQPSNAPAGSNLPDLTSPERYQP